MNFALFLARLASDDTLFGAARPQEQMIMITRTAIVTPFLFPFIFFFHAALCVSAFASPVDVDHACIKSFNLESCGFYDSLYDPNHKQNSVTLISREYFFKDSDDHLTRFHQSPWYLENESHESLLNLEAEHHETTTLFPTPINSNQQSSPVSLPAAISILGAGLLCLIGLRRKKSFR